MWSDVASGDALKIAMYGTAVNAHVLTLLLRWIVVLAQQRGTSWPPRSAAVEFWHNAHKECFIRRKMREASEKCRAMGFSITNFNAPCHPKCSVEALHAYERQHGEQKEQHYPINLSHSGLKVLSADYGLFQIDNFIDPAHLRAPFNVATAVYPSSTPANHDYLVALQRNKSFCQWANDPEEYKPENVTECDWMIAEMRHYQLHKYQLRTSSQVEADVSLWLESWEAIHAELDKLLPDFPRDVREPILLSHYGKGGYYSAHVDGRRCSIILYADDDGDGGATYFPLLDIRVPRKAGRAIVFFSNTVDGRGKGALLHTAEEVTRGQKSVLQIFMDENCVSPVLTPRCAAREGLAPHFDL